MARRNKSVSAAPANKRQCPVCKSFKTTSVYRGRENIRGRRVDESECRCLACATTWHESFMVRAQEFKVTDIQLGSAQQPTKPAIPQTPAPEVHTPVASPITPPKLVESDPDACPVCGSKRLSIDPRGTMMRENQSVHEGLYTCLDCGAEWLERYYTESKKTRRFNLKRPLP